MKVDQQSDPLLNNALKSTKPGGHINLTAEREGEEVTIRLKDSGNGIDNKVRGRLIQ